MDTTTPHWNLYVFMWYYMVKTGDIQNKQAIPEVLEYIEYNFVHLRTTTHLCFKTRRGRPR